MRTILLGICIAITSTVMAQRECAVTDYLSQQTAVDPALPQRIQSIEQFIKQQAHAKMEGEESNVIRIPVVVHILYKSALENISDEQVRSQIEVLNRDFRRRNADTVNTPLRFKAFAADVPIEFFLATADPYGRSTNGIVRKQTSTAQWKVDDKIKYSAYGGDDAWDSRSYLNIWVGNLGGTQGYSSMPGGAPEKDGIAIHFTAFGTINSSAPHHLGRTAVHETGHWLGLKHIWGDTYCGDDMVDDTPKQGNFTTGCPTGFRTSCNNNATG
ncbi:MAG: M43 family zinc metalloprotease, partial [Flavisolibacter sp.]